MGKRIFISYGHDQDAFAEQLRTSLIGLGHDVWIDTYQIKGGRDWEIAIEKGLMLTDIVIAVLSPHAVRRPDGVCINEISFARYLFRPIVPVMVELCRPPLSICHLSWVDFQRWREPEIYQLRLQRLADSLEKGEVESEGGQARLRNLLDPLEDVESRADTRFTGREWVIQDFENWLRDPDGPKIFLLSGEPGVGKSAIARHLCRNRAELAGAHFFRYNQGEKSSVQRCVRSLTYQMSTQWPEYLDLLMEIDLERMPRDVPSIFDRVIAQPLARLTAMKGPQVLVLDAIDEAADGRTDELVDLIANQFCGTPAWLRLFITTRQEKHILRKLSRLQSYVLEKSDRRNLDDVRKLVSVRLKETIENPPAGAVETIALRSEGIFLYVDTVLEEVRKGRLSLTSLDEFPVGLTSIFTYLFERYFPDRVEYGSRYRPLMELVAAGREVISLQLASWLLEWEDYDEANAIERWTPLFADPARRLEPFHRAVMEWVTDRDKAGDYFVSASSGSRRFAEGVQRWAQAPAGEARNHLLRYGIDYLLERDCRSSGTAEVLALCRRDNRSFLAAALRYCKPRWLEEQMQRVFRAYLQMRYWAGAASAMVHLQVLRERLQPLPTVLAIMADAKPVLSSSLEALEVIGDVSMQRCIALAALAKIWDSGDSHAHSALLDWLLQRHPQSFALGRDTWDSACLSALLEDGPQALAERLLDARLYALPDHYWGALATVWRRDCPGVLRTRVLAGLSAGREQESFSISALHAVASAALRSGDDEILLESIRRISISGVNAELESLSLTHLLERPLPTVLECVARLSANVRLRDYPAGRAALAGLVLLSPAVSDLTYLEEITRSLAVITATTAGEIIASMAACSPASIRVISMKPAEFHQWLASRVALFTGPFRTEAATGSQKSLGRLVFEICSFIRWIAAQAPEREGWDHLGAALVSISGLAWTDSANWGTPLDVSSPSALIVTAADPIRAFAVADTALWLEQQGWPARCDFNLHAQLQRRSAQEFVRKAFGNAGEAELTNMEKALEKAWPAPLPREPGSLEGSEWLDVLRTIAGWLGYSWRQSWTSNLNDKSALPKGLRSGLEDLAGRISHVAAETCFHPSLLKLSYYIAFVLAEDSVSAEESDELQMPALAAMDPALAAFVHHNGYWPEEFLPLVYAQVVPAAFSRAASSMGVNGRSILWGLARDLCRPGPDAVSGNWRQSVAMFRSEIREQSGSNSQLIGAAAELQPGNLEAALAPLNLLLDTPPDRKDFDVLSHEIYFRGLRFDQSDSFARLKRLIDSQPGKSLLKWAKDEFSRRSPEQARWLLESLIRNREWELLQGFLASQFPQPHSEERSLVFRKARESEPAGRTEKPAGLAEALGLGREESLIYRVPELASRARNGTLWEDPAAREYRDKVRYSENWQQKVVDVFNRTFLPSPREVVLTLLVVALLKNDPEPALLADELSKGWPLNLEVELAWTGSVVCDRLASEVRLEKIATDARGLDLLVALGKWHLVRKHLHFAAHRSGSMSRPDPLSQWYRQCDAFRPGEQVRCLRMFLEDAPALLAVRPENAGVARLTGGRMLRPVSEVAETLRFSEDELSRKLVLAAAAGDKDRLTLWFAAVMIEARYGPDRGARLECVQTLCRAAGVLLSVIDDQRLRHEWFKAAERWSVLFDTTRIWESLYAGAGESLKLDFGKSLQRWYRGGDDKAILALGKELTKHGSLEDATTYWDAEIRADRSALLSLWASTTLRLRGEHGGETSRAGSRFLAQAWELARGTEIAIEPLFLAQVVDNAVHWRCSSVFKDLADSLAAAPSRAQTVARMALDRYLSNLPKTGPALRIDEFSETGGMRALVAVLIDHPVLLEDGGDFDLSGHEWSDPDMARGLLWIAVLTREVACRPRPIDGLAWIAGWIQQIDAGGDDGWIVARCFAEIAVELEAEDMPAITPLLDFAISSAELAPGDAAHHFALMLRLLELRYRVNDCLEILNRALETSSRTLNIDKRLATIAVTCAELFPADELLTESYLARMRNTGDRTIAADDAAEVRHLSIGKRLAALAGVERSAGVVKRMSNLCRRLSDGIADLSDDDLAVLIGPLSSLILQDMELYKAAAGRLVPLLNPGELVEVRRDEEELQLMSPGGATASV